MKSVLLYSKSYSGSPSLVTEKQNENDMVLEKEEDALEPVSPSSQYFNSSALNVSVLGVLETEVPIDDSKTIPLVRDVFLPINPRFSSIMVLSLSLSRPLCQVYEHVSHYFFFFLFLFFGKKATFLSVQRHAAVLYLFQQITISVLVKFWLLYCEKRYSRYVSPTLLCIFPTNRFLWRPILAYRSCDR